MNQNRRQELNTAKHSEFEPIDSALLGSLRSGDQQAFETVYLRYMSSVRNFLVALTRSQEVGKEIAQNVFVTLWERRENIDPEKNISGYLYTIAKNYALKYFNRQKNAFTEELSEADRFAGDVAPDEVLIAREKEIIIEIAISRMPAQRRKIYELSRKEGLSNSEIAERLQISKNTVENHITSALKDLREVLGLFILLIFS